MHRWQRCLLQILARPQSAAVWSTVEAQLETEAGGSQASAFVTGATTIRDAGHTHKTFRLSARMPRHGYIGCQTLSTGCKNAMQLPEGMVVLVQEATVQAAVVRNTGQ
eukprot:741200-Pleurochrysis_carterae.AAC.1